ADRGKSGAARKRRRGRRDEDAPRRGGARRARQAAGPEAGRLSRDAHGLAAYPESGRRVSGDDPLRPRRSGQRDGARGQGGGSGPAIGGDGSRQRRDEPLMSRPALPWFPVVALLALLGGCAQPRPAPSPPPPSPTAAIDGTYKGTANGSCGNDRPATATLRDGRFALTVPPDLRLEGRARGNGV